MLLAAGPRFGVDGAFERYLRLPYTVRRDRAEPALDRLVAAWHTLDEAHPETEPTAVACIRESATLPRESARAHG